jgi:tRNA G10  N-methylase Trm11
MTKKNIFSFNISNILFDDKAELLPSVTELFELELAYLEYNSLPKNSLVKRCAYFKTVNSKSTQHFQANTFKPTFEILTRSTKTKNYFDNGQFSTGYATHSLFPYRGKFHPQLIKCLLNIMELKIGDLLLDPMSGSGTANIESSLLGIDSVAVDISPFCRLMIKTKYESLLLNKEGLELLEQNESNLFKYFSNNKKFDFKVDPNFFRTEGEYYIALLAFLDSMGYFNRTKSFTHEELFSRVFERYIFTVRNYLDNPFFSDNLGEVRISKESSAMDLKFDDNSFDGIITSPPYSFAIDYAKNDQDQLNYLGINVDDLKSRMIGLRGKNKTERLSNYFDDMKIVCREMARVLKTNRYAVIIIGSNTNQTGGIRLEDKIISFCEEAKLKLVKSIVKPIKGMRNTMKDEYVLIFKK